MISAPRRPSAALLPSGAMRTMSAAPRAAVALLAAVLLLAVPVRNGRAAERRPRPDATARSSSSGAFSIGLIGDTGYTPEGRHNLLAVRASANAAGLAFVVHDGDIWQGGTPCTDDRLRAVKAVFDGFDALVYTPGDNEWQDCPDADADGRLPAIRRVFFAQPDSLGRWPIGQHRQPGAPENARWERAGVVFATLDVPGPKGGGPAGPADRAWLDSTFDRAEAIGAPAVMIAWQDDPTDGSSARLVDRLRARARGFGRPVVLVHGDTHRHRRDRPWPDVPNLTRLETFPGTTPEWVKATVDPSRPGVFSFTTMRG